MCVPYITLICFLIVQELIWQNAIGFMFVHWVFGFLCESSLRSNLNKYCHICRLVTSMFPYGEWCSCLLGKVVCVLRSRVASSSPQGSCPQVDIWPCLMAAHCKMLDSKCHTWIHGKHKSSIGWGHSSLDYSYTCFNGVKRCSSLINK